MKNLQEKSPVYYAEADVYDAFSRAEDAGHLVFDALKPLVAGRKVLDLGCGTGKYLELLAPYAAHITGLDAATAQLDIARKRTSAFRNVTLIRGDAVDAPLPAEGYDVVIACWMLGTIADEAKRLAILRRFERPGTLMVLAENAESSEFENIRGRVNDPLTRTRRYNDWLTERGFRATQMLEGHFAFPTLRDAQDVFAAIWGEDKRQLISSGQIAHKIAIYQKRISG
jgi:ubiquinone/menaquinone biosynthesis C-methylase UbiE